MFDISKSDFLRVRRTYRKLLGRVFTMEVTVKIKLREALKLLKDEALETRK